MFKTIVTTLTMSLFVAASTTSALAFGAIAVNDEQGMAAEDVGYALGWGSTQKEAEKNAVKECIAVGNDQCKAVVWFEQCGAYAGDRVNYGIGYGSSKKAAESMAQENCPNCKIIVSDCQ